MSLVNIMIVDSSGQLENSIYYAKNMANRKEKKKENCKKALFNLIFHYSQSN